MGRAGLVLVLLASCSPIASPEATAAAREAQDLDAWLRACAVTDEDFARRTIFTWTRAGQIEELRAGERLLSRTHGASGRASAFDLALAGDPYPLAQALLQLPNRTRRFGWASPWPTRMGWEQSDYGDRLIEVRLRAGTWTARFEPSAARRWRVVDAEGRDVSDEEVALAPERVGAVYHLGRGVDADGSERIFRELVLVREERIERWSVGTEAIAARVRDDAARLRRLARIFRQSPLHGAPADRAAMTAWMQERMSMTAATTIADRYAACLALASTRYLPRAPEIEAVAVALERMPEEAPLERRAPP